MSGDLHDGRPASVAPTSAEIVFVRLGRLATLTGHRQAVGARVEHLAHDFVTKAEHLRGRRPLIVNEMLAQDHCRMLTTSSCGRL